MKLLVAMIALCIVIAYVCANILFGLWIAWNWVIPVLLLLMMYALPATLCYYVAYRIWKEFQ